MHISELKEYYPPGRQAEEKVEITDIEPATIENTWVGKAVMPDTAKAKKVVIYALTLANGDTEYRVVPAACPHQGYDISYDELKTDGNVYCTLHKRPICIYSEYNHAYRAEISDDNRYYLV